MDQKIEKANREFKLFVTREARWWTWGKVLVAAALVLLILEVGSYAFNWTWTGFQDNNTVWDWLQLLLLPVALAAVPIWFTAEEAQQRIWLGQLRWVLVAALVVLAVLFVGTYAFNWTWTGFKDHGRVWDWLSLLLVPVSVATLPIWYSIRQSHSSGMSQQAQE